MPSTKPAPRREKKTTAGVSAQDKRRSCYFCKEKVEEVDFKSSPTLHRIVSDTGKIRPRRTTGTCRRHQNQVEVAVKRAREMALLPNVSR
jgi:small subunit ribosomal protein S18